MNPWSRVWLDLGIFPGRLASIPGATTSSRTLPIRSRTWVDGGTAVVGQGAVAHPDDLQHRLNRWVHDAVDVANEWIHERSPPAQADADTVEAVAG
uniref:Uncharacterized protein n=1 Tax=Arundo donax TaxID=35708 RepID=A0A0A9HE09_ARUDO